MRSVRGVRAALLRLRRWAECANRYRSPIGVGLIRREWLSLELAQVAGHCGRMNGKGQSDLGSARAKTSVKLVRSLAAALLLGACASEPAPSAPDPLAFIEPQAQVSLPTPEPIAPGSNGGGFTIVVDPPITAICRDGWISYSQRQSGTCSGHRGVREWVNRPIR